MTYHGKVQNGVIVLEEGFNLPEGTEVEVQPTDVKVDRDAESLRQSLLKLAGRLKGYPLDFAKNHDHYIHGAPKKP